MSTDSGKLVYKFRGLFSVKLIFTKSASWWKTKEASIVFTVVELKWFRANLIFILNQQGIHTV